MAKQEVSGVKTEDDVLDELRACLLDIAEMQSADVVLYSGKIDHPGDPNLFHCVRSFRKRPNVLFHLTTNGGSAESAYRIGRCLQKMYPPPGKVILFVDSFCKSAGTLVALGADEIVMSEMAELGPLDVQLRKEDALAEQTSGLTPTKAISILSQRAFDALEESFLNLRFRSGLQITTKTALEIASNLATGLFSPIFAQIDPMRLGEIERAMAIARDYGTRLARGNQKEDAIDKLVAKYPSHGFVIDKEEACEFFNCVRRPTEIEERLSALVTPFVMAGLKAAEESRPPTVEFLSILLEPSGIAEGDKHGRKKAKSRRVQATAGGNGPASNQAVRPETVAAVRMRKSITAAVSKNGSNGG